MTWQINPKTPLDRKLDRAWERLSYRSVNVGGWYRKLEVTKGAFKKVLKEVFDEKGK